MSATKKPNGDFRVPERLIKLPEDMDKWTKSQAYAEMIGFIYTLNESVKGRMNSDPLPPSPAIDRLLAMLEKLSLWVDEIPPIQQPQRFGNQAFRKWRDRLSENAQSLIRDLLPEDLHGAAAELEPYLREGFGNRTRIDYGTGHELKFMAFVCCLMELGAIPQSDAAAVVIRVVGRYLDLMRKIQTVYRMEPAGSHGVWGLDDFQFLPFIWGSAQLIGNHKLEPKSFVEPDVPETYAKDYLFMSCITYINKVKTGPFAEHSNTLWGISGVPDWNKVNSGLIKMYKAEVLGKFPVIQHFPFGTILSLDPKKS
ncbi:hypothetical protein EMCRGX_G020141 [Ephydatia muelleri]